MNPFHYPTINLASKSPRRAELLKQMGVPFEVVLPLHPHEAEALEHALPHEEPLAYVKRVSMAKAKMMYAQILKHGSAFQKSLPTLCADTTVAYQNTILGKPNHAQHAREMLLCLSGQTHQVHTAIVVAYRGAFVQKVVSSDVLFRSIDSDELQSYIDSGEPFGKAGAYAIQGYGACFVAHLSGSFSAVKGLPIFELGQILKRL